MALKLMYITNSPQVALIAESAGVDIIFVDMEYIGKFDRQGGMDSVQSHHTFQDIRSIRHVITKSELLVRCNPIHNASSEYSSSIDEINGIIDCGADIIMLPFFKTVTEVETFVKIVNKRVKTMILVETPEAVENLDEILAIQGIDYVHIGLNDLSLGYHKKFMFELLADYTVDVICSKIKKAGIPYGFGGIAMLGRGDVPSELIIKEHYRLGSRCAILSRSFCNTSLISDLNEIETIFKKGLSDIRNYEKKCEKEFYPFQHNINEIQNKISKIIGEKK